MSNDRGVLAVGLLFAGGLTDSGLGHLVGWLVGGAIVGGGAGYAAVAVASVPLTVAGGVGLGVALGGGLGTVAHLLATAEDLDDSDDVERDAVTVDMGASDEHEPRPADLFEEYPEPLLYAVDAGHGPVVRAANPAYAEAFDVPRGTLDGAPLGEALLVDADSEAIADRLAAGGDPGVVHCEDRPFELTRIGEGRDFYVRYQPASPGTEV